MKWQSMKTAPRDGTWVWVTFEAVDGERWVAAWRYSYPKDAIAWMPGEPTPYTGTLEELDAEVDS